MSNVKKVEEVVELSIVDRLMEDVLMNEKVSKKMSEKDLLEFIVENFDDEDIKSKNGMLKFLRSSGLSCSMDRVFNMYKLVESEKVKMKNEVKIVEEVVKEGK